MCRYIGINSKEKGLLTFKTRQIYSCVVICFTYSKDIISSNMSVTETGENFNNITYTLS